MFVVSGLMAAISAVLAQPFTLRPNDLVIANYDTGSVVKIDGVTGTQEVLASGLVIPTDVTIDDGGNVYITELPGSIRHLDLQTGDLRTVMASGSGPSLLYGITQAGSGDLYVTSRGDQSVYRVDPLSGVPSLITQSNLLYTPVGIDMLDPDHLVVACLLANRLVSIALADQSQAVIAEGGTLDQPWGVAVHGNDIYVGAYDAKKLQRVNAGQVFPVTTLAGFPYGLAVDSAGNPVVGWKEVGQSVQRIGPDGSVIQSYTGSAIRWVTGVAVRSAILVPGEDTDGDGMTNGDEEVAGTDPLDPDSVLWVSVISLSPSPTIQWPSVVNRSYSVLGRDQLGLGLVVLDANLEATPPLNDWTLPDLGIDYSVFQIQVQQLP